MANEKQRERDPQLSNPFSTGGGGHEFEQRVAANYLVSLLAGDLPRGLPSGTTRRVALQCRWEGACVDDIKVTASNDENEFRLLLQVKHELTFTARDTVFAQVVCECWETLERRRGVEFDEARDRLGIVVGGISQTARLHLRPLLEWARASKNAAEFITKAESAGFSSGRKRKYLRGLRTLIGQAKGGWPPQPQPGSGEQPTAPSPATDEDVWRLLRVLVIMDFDFGHAGSRDATSVWNRLLDFLPERDAGAARQLAASLFSIAAGEAKHAGTFDLTGLRTRLASMGLADAASHASALRRLREHTDEVLGEIRTSIGQRVTLARDDAQAALIERVGAHDVVVVIGDSMVGKSALVKQFALKLRDEGETFVFSVDRLEGRSLTAFLANSLNVQTRFADLLAAAGSAPLPVVVCDGLDRAWNDDRRRIVSELAAAIADHNQRLEEGGVDAAYRWRLLLTCRSEEARHLLGSIPALRGQDVATLEVASLSRAELEIVGTKLPFLQRALGNSQLQPVLAKPLVLDILTIPDIALSLDPSSAPLTEARLCQWYWRHVIRLDERRGTGRGHPDDRETVVQALARQSLEGETLRPPNAVDREALDGLTSDRVVMRDGARWRFAHDAILDWALSMLLEGKDDPVQFLSERPLDFRLDRAVALLSERRLEAADATGWERLLEDLGTQPSSTPRRREACLVALARSARARDFLGVLSPALLAPAGQLLADFVRTVRQRCVRPSETMLRSFPGAAREAMANYFVYWTDPLETAWAPVLRFLAAESARVPKDALGEVAQLAKEWMRKQTGDPSLRQDLTMVCLGWLEEHGLWSSYQDAPRNDLFEAVLWSADLLPDVVEQVANQHGARNRERDTRGFEDVLLEIFGWMPLVKHLPSTARTILTRLLCYSLEPDRFGCLSVVEHDLAIRHVHRWSVPSPEEGPFYALLKFHPEDGLQLVKALVRHATQAWRLRERYTTHLPRRTPVPNEVCFDDHSETVWGDDRVYCWHRHPSCAPTTVTTALMALERWMIEQVEADRDPSELFSKVVRDSESVAMVGLCGSVALARPQACAQALIPILEKPACWLMDRHRHGQDLAAAGAIAMFAAMSPDGERTHRRARELADEPHRQAPIGALVPALVLSNAPGTERLCTALRAFPENVPVYFEEQREDPALVRDHREQCEDWARLTEPENYSREERGDGVVVMRPQLSAGALARANAAETRLSVFALQMWAEQLLRDGIVEDRFTLDAALTEAQALASRNAVSEDQPLRTSDDRAQAIMAVAATAAALVARKTDWTEQHGCFAWCREQLLLAVQREEFIGFLGHPLMPGDHYPQDPKRSAARGLPAVLAANPEDQVVVEVIFQLSMHPSIEVRGYLLSAVQAQPGMVVLVWECLQSTLVNAHVAVLQRQEGRGTPLAQETFEALETSLAALAGSDDSVFAPDILTPAVLALSADLYQTLEEEDQRATQLAITESLLAYTINCYDAHRARSRHGSEYNEWSTYTKWNFPFFQRLAELLVVAPPEEADQLLARVREAWRREPDVLQRLLSSLVLPGTCPENMDRFLELWNGFADEVLAALESDPELLSRRARHDLLKDLLFDGVSWKPGATLQLGSTSGWIGRWVALCGSHRDCFGTLARLLAGPGRESLLGEGLVWLNAALGGADDAVDLLRRSRTSSLLSRSLQRLWRESARQLLAAHASMGLFVRITDLLAASGERLAINLQENLAAARGA